MTKLEKFMEERYVGDYDFAANYFAAQEPKPTSEVFDNHYWNFNKRAGFDEITKDPEAWGRLELLRAVKNDQERARGGR